MSTRTITNGFWKILTTEQAWYIRNNEDIELYILHEDDSESLVYTDDELKKAIDLNISIGIECFDVRKLKNKAIL